MNDYETTSKNPNENQGQTPAGLPSENEHCRGQGYDKEAAAKGKKTVEPVVMRTPLAKARLWLLKILVEGIRSYQRHLSCLLPSACRYHPNCSSYFIEALNSCGIFSGLFKGGWRLLRCHPFSAGGYDPVNIKEAYEK